MNDEGLADATDGRAAGSGRNGELIERMRGVYETADLERIERAALAYWTEQTTDEFPQSGEVFRGRAAVEAMVEAWPTAMGGWPRLAVREIRGRGDVWVIEPVVDYGAGMTANVATVVELDEGTIRRQTDYFAAPFDAPDWRRTFRADSR